jgi:hypothetical protein
VEGCEVYGDVGSEFFENPGGHLFQFGVTVILAGDQQVGDL